MYLQDCDEVYTYIYIRRINRKLLFVLGHLHEELRTGFTCNILLLSFDWQKVCEENLIKSQKCEFDSPTSFVYSLKQASVRDCYASSSSFDL